MLNKSWEQEASDGWLPAPRGHCRMAVRLHAVNALGVLSPDYMLIQVDPRKGSGAYVRIEWNPARFTDDQHEWLYSRLDSLCIVGGHIWSGTVTRVDAAVDLPGVDIRLYSLPSSACVPRSRTARAAWPPAPAARVRAPPRPAPRR